MRLDTRAFARAAGLTSGAVVLLVTLLLAVFGVAVDRPALSVVWPGYTVSALGAVIGAVYAALSGFVVGAMFAVIYNLVSVPPAPPPFDWNGDTRAEDT